MATKTPADIFGGITPTAKAKATALPTWAKALAIATGIVVSYLVIGDLGAYLIAGSSGAWLIWSWHREKGNIVDSLVAWIFLTALLASRLAAPINTTADGIRQIGPAVKDAVGAEIAEIRNGDPAPLPAAKAEVAPPAPDGPK